MLPKMQDLRAVLGRGFATRCCIIWGFEYFVQFILFISFRSLDFQFPICGSSFPPFHFLRLEVIGTIVPMSSNKNTSSSFGGAHHKMPANKNRNISSYSSTSETVGSGRKKIVDDFVSTPQNKTPNKSGLTPIRPTKSPGNGMKLKSGLTPVRPGVSQGPAKSPFTQKPKLKSGLLPIKPSVQTQQVDEFNCSTFISRRKSGLKPIKPGGTMPYYPSQARNDASVLETKPFTFAAPKHIPKGEKSSEIVHGASRRKSGLAPIKHSFGVASDHTSSWKPRSSVSHSSVQGLLPNARKTCKPVESTPSLNIINEDSESNVSGICQLDDSADMSVVLRPRTGKRLSSRIPLPRTTLDSAHFSSSEITKTRIPKRVLYFPDDDDKDRTHSNVLKDGSFRANIVDGQSTASNNDLDSENLHSFSKNHADAIDKEEKSLLRRKKEIESAIQKMSSELKEIEEQLRLLPDKRKNPSTHASENVKECEDEADSPFAHVVSPVSTDPLELLTLDKSKQPDNIYKSFRQSCSFLKTPQHSAFLKPRNPLRSSQLAEDSPNVSLRLQKQLAELFAE